MVSHVVPAIPAATFFSDPISLEFCIGLGLSWLFVRRGTLPSGIFPFLLGVSFLALSANFVKHPTTAGLVSWPRVIAWGAPAALIVASVTSIRNAVNPIRKAAILLGDASYAIYLTHVFVMITYAKLLKTTLVGAVSQTAIIPIIVFSAAGFGVICHWYVELPIARLLRKFRRRFSEDTTPAMTT